MEEVCDHRSFKTMPVCTNALHFTVIALGGSQSARQNTMIKMHRYLKMKDLLRLVQKYS
jgi:hypothetical protein